MTDNELKQLYANDPDYQEYVDKCRAVDGRTIDEEIALKIVQYVGEHYLERSRGR